jgi:hypothetical protein
MSVIIGVLITFLVVILVLYLVNMLLIDGRAKRIVQVIVIVIGIVSMARDWYDYFYGLHQDVLDLEQRVAALKDFYREGTWTPVLTWEGTNDLSVKYQEQTGTYQRFRNLVRVNFRVNTASFTYTTANLAIELHGLPFSVASGTNSGGSANLLFEGINKVGYTQFMMGPRPGTSVLTGFASGPGQIIFDIRPADVPSGSSIILLGDAWYETTDP